MKDLQDGVIEYSESPVEMVKIALGRHEQWLKEPQFYPKQGNRLVWKTLSKEQKICFLQQFDFSKKCLPHMDLSEIDLSKRDLKKSVFICYDLSKADFRQSDLFCVIFKKSDLHQVKVTLTPALFTVVFQENRGAEEIQFFNQEGLKYTGIRLNPKTGLLEKQPMTLQDVPLIRSGRAVFCDFDSLFMEASQLYPKEMKLLGYHLKTKEQEKKSQQRGYRI